MAGKIAAALAEYGEQDLSVKLCRNLFGVVPGAPEFAWYRDLGGATARVAPGADAGATSRLADEDGAEKVLWVASALDKADMGLAVMSGVSNLFSFFGGAGGTKKRTFESDPQQTADAALKVLGLSYMIAKLFPGDMKEKVGAFMALPAGREALLYTATIEIALPFTDNVVEGAGSVVSRLMSKGGTATSRMAGFAGAAGLGEAQSVLGAFRSTLDGAVGKASGAVGPIVGKLKGFIPGAIGAADSLTGAVATGADALPVWRLLGARLAAEACAARATSN